MCMMFEIPSEVAGDNQVIGYMPNIDNVNVMHHIVVRTCPFSVCELIPS